MPILLPQSVQPLDSPGLHLIIGDPIGHSLSPLIYNSLYARYQMPIQAMTCRVSPSDLAAFFTLAKGLNLCALNVTMPHKEAVIDHLDWVDPDAHAKCSVNSIAIAESRFRGYSTDGTGFSLSLEEKGVSMAGKRVALLGNGGAAAAIAWQAVKEGASSLVLLARDAKKAATLLEGLPHNSPCATAAGSMDSLATHAAECEILINATPLGMDGFAGGNFPTLGFLSALPKQAVVCDIVYRPARTALLAEAERLDLRTVGGLGMLIWQAIAAFTIFYGIIPSGEDRAAINAAAAARLLG